MFLTIGNIRKERWILKSTLKELLAGLDEEKQKAINEAVTALVESKVSEKAEALATAVKDLDLLQKRYDKAVKGFNTLQSQTKGAEVDKYIASLVKSDTQRKLLKEVSNVNLNEDLEAIKKTIKTKATEYANVFSQGFNDHNFHGLNDFNLPGNDVQGSLKDEDEKPDLPKSDKLDLAFGDTF